MGLALLLGGCGDATDRPRPEVSGVADAYVDQIDDLLDGNATELERSVLSDYRVTDEEHAQAQQAFRECVATTDPGLDVQFLAAGGFDVVGSPEFWDSAESEDAGLEVIDRVVRACGPGTLQNIDALYVDMQRNPEGLSYAEALRACWQAGGLPDGADLTDEELEELLASGDTLEPSGPEAEACLTDPWGPPPPPAP